MNISIANLVKRFDKIKSDRANWEAHWQECADYCFPQKATITNQRSPGTKLKTTIYDSSALEAVPIASAGLHSYMTNPSSRWFSLEMKDPKFNEDTEVREWLKECVNIEFGYLNDSNFNEVMPDFYSDFIVFGNPCLYEERDYEEVINFSIRPVSEIYFLVNERSRIDTIYRYFTFTARQAFQKWGNNAGQKVLDMMEAQRVEESIPFLHIVLPREERDVKKRDARNMSFSSLYIEPQTKKVLSEGGYEEFPFFIPRFYKTSDSEYAYSPASVALADIKMLNQMSKDLLEAAAKTLHPPVILPNDGYLLPFKTTPKAINYKLSTNPEDKVEVLQIARELNLTLEMLNQRRQSISRIFFVDLFLMLANLPDKQRTATEIAERVNERMLILGPALGRLMKSLAGVVERTFAILMRDGRLPPPPEKIQGQQYKVKFISPLAKAQRATEAKSVSDMLMAIRAMAELEPAVIDNINLDKASKKFGDIFDTAEILRGDDEMAAKRQQRAEQVKMQQEIELFKMGASGGKDAAQAIKTLKEGGEKVAK
jgi:hypothetical protein